jgi:hypothetical protein
MSWFNEAPMTAETREKLLATKTAKGRTGLALLLADMPSVTYNMAMGVLKVAPRCRPGLEAYNAGRAHAKRLLGK